MLSFPALSWGSLAPAHHQVRYGARPARGSPRASAVSAVQFAAAVAVHIAAAARRAAPRLCSAEKSARCLREGRPHDVGVGVDAGVVEPLSAFRCEAALAAPLHVLRTGAGRRARHTQLPLADSLESAAPERPLTACSAITVMGEVSELRLHPRSRSASSVPQNRKARTRA